MNGGERLKKPNSLIQLLGFIFAIIGVVFIGAGYLNRVGILHTSPRSQGDPSVIFPIVGDIFLVAGVISYFISLYKGKKRRMLKSTGINIQGTVTRIKQLPYVSVGREHPYIVYFSYEYFGKKYEGRSQFLWNEPDISEGDTIDVYIDHYREHQYYAEVKGFDSIK